MLVSLLFGIPGLSWDSPIQHFEAFSGEAEVTKAEWRVVRMTFRQVFTFSPILQLYREPPVKPHPFEGFKKQVVVVGMNLRQRFLLGGSQSNCFINVYLLVPPKKYGHLFHGVKNLLNYFHQSRLRGAQYPLTFVWMQPTWTYYQMKDLPTLYSLPATFPQDQAMFLHQCAVPGYLWHIAGWSTKFSFWGSLYFGGFSSQRKVCIYWYSYWFKALKHHRTMHSWGAESAQGGPRPNLWAEKTVKPLLRGTFWQRERCCCF